LSEHALESRDVDDIERERAFAKRVDLVDTITLLRELLPDRVAVAHPDLCVDELDEPSFVQRPELLPAPT
jgi:hypothetical protein